MVDHRQSKPTFTYTTLHHMAMRRTMVLNHITQHLQNLLSSPYPVHIYTTILDVGREVLNDWPKQASIYILMILSLVTFLRIIFYW